jgi:hypothetical protein
VAIKSRQPTNLYRESLLALVADMVGLFVGYFRVKKVCTLCKMIWQCVLVELEIEGMPPGGMILPMSAVYPTSAPPGPAGRWLVERMKLCSGKPMAA